MVHSLSQRACPGDKVYTVPLPLLPVPPPRSVPLIGGLLSYSPPATVAGPFLRQSPDLIVQQNKTGAYHGDNSDRSIAHDTGVY